MCFILYIVCVHSSSSRSTRGRRFTPFERNENFGSRYLSIRRDLCHSYGYPYNCLLSLILSKYSQHSLLDGRSNDIFTQHRYFFSIFQHEHEDFERRTRRRVSVSLGNGMRSDVMRRRLPRCEQHMYCMSIGTVKSCGWWFFRSGHELRYVQNHDESRA